MSEYFSKRAYSQYSQHVRILGQGHLCSQFPFQWTKRKSPPPSNISNRPAITRKASRVIPRHSTLSLTYSDPKIDAEK